MAHQALNFEYEKQHEETKAFIHAKTEDGRFFIKSITKQECKEIRKKMVPQLVQDLQQGRHVSICPIMSLFKIVLDKTALRFCVTLNLFDLNRTEMLECLSIGAPSNQSEMRFSVGGSNDHGRRFSLSLARKEACEPSALPKDVRKSLWLTNHRFLVQVNKETDASWADMF